MGNGIIDLGALLAQARGDYPPGRHIEVSGGRRVFVREAAEPFSGAPVLLCYPGWTAPGGPNYAGVLADLSKRFRVLLVDNPGAGRTETADPFTIREAARDGIEVLERLGVRHAYVMGYSMGGPIASLHALLRPDQVQALALCSTSNAFGLAFDVMYPLKVAAAVLAKVPRQLLRLPMLPDLEDLPFGRAVDEFAHDDPRALVQAGLQLSRWQSRSWLPRLRMPVAVVETRLDGLVPPRDQRRMQQLIPQARLYSVWATHLTAPLGVGDWPATVSRAMRDLQRQVEGSHRAGRRQEPRGRRTVGG